MAIFRRNRPQPDNAPRPAAFDPAAYGLVPDAAVAVDPARGDAELAEAIGAARGGDWKPAAGLLAATGGDWNLRYSRVELLALDCTHTADAWFHAWRTEAPDSPDMAVVHAQVLRNQAGKARGAAWAKATSREQFEAFFRITGEADAAAIRAAQLAPDDPTPWVTRIGAALGRQLPHEEFNALWDELFARDQLHRRGHSYAHQYWLAKWFGSDALSAKFVADATARAPHTALAFELNLHRLQECWLAVRDAGPSGAVRFADYCGSEPGRSLLEVALYQWDGALPTGGAYQMVDRNLLAWALTMARRYDEACDVFASLGGCVTAGYPWMYYKDAAAAFRALRAEAFKNSSRRPIR